MAEHGNDPDSWSRSSDHLGNLANILKDLSGGSSLLHELLQNANDADAERVSFTAQRDELTVWNSAVFSDCGDQDVRQCPWKTEGGHRSCDLHSFRKVAGRHKADDDATTGAFGVGFTAVYQVTDHPELVTGGRHLVLDESQPEEQRIRICPGGCTRDHSTGGTTFYLPWARDQSELRRELGGSPLDERDIDELTSQLREAAGPALLFLERVQRLEVVTERGSKNVTRDRVGDRVVVTINGNAREWLLLEGSAEGAEQLKQDYDQGGSHSAVVQVAVPIDGTRGGRVYADLPTETASGWSGHINGTFYPRQDRKSVEFDGPGFRGKWNDLLIDTAANVVAQNLETIAGAAGHEVVWAYLVDAELVNRAISKGDYPKAFSAFLTRTKGMAPIASIALLADGTSATPYGCIVPRDEVEYDAVDLLGGLGLPIVDRTIRPHVLRVTRTDYGIHELSASDVAGALRQAELVGHWTPGPGTRFSSGDVETLLRLLSHLQERGKTILLDAGFADLAIVPCVDGSFVPPKDVCVFEDDDRALFELLAPDLRILDRERLDALCPSLGELCRDITPQRAIGIFEREADSLSVAPDQVLDWLDNHRAALAIEDMKARVRALPIYPSARGDLVPLTSVSLPSDFDDVLGVAQLLDRDKIVGHTDLLHLLGATELDAVEYLGRHVVAAAHAGDISEEQASSILELIHRHQYELTKDGRELSSLAEAPLVPTNQGMKPATDVHLPNPALSLIDPEAPVANIDELPPHLVDTLVWLGVSRNPNDETLCAAATRLEGQQDPPDTRVVLAILDSLPNPPLDEDVPESLRGLTTSAWLPVEGGVGARPGAVYPAFNRYLFDSQGPHLGIPGHDQRRLAGVLNWLGVPKAPTTVMVVRHLRHCARTGTEVHPQVFRALGEASEESLVESLRDGPCVQVAPGEFMEPTFVFWTDPGLGTWVRHLPLGSRSDQAFYDRVGVADSPSPDQLEQILRRISRASGNERLGEDDQAVVHRCWELLDQQLPEAEDALGRLGAVKSALGPRGLLEKPELLLFADGRRLAEEIRLIRDNLIRRDRTTQRALSAAGVRAAEEVITPHVDDDLESSPATKILGVLADRLPALERLVEAQRADGSEFDLADLTDLRIDVMPGLAVEYVTRFGGAQHTTEPRSTEAIYLPEQHRLITRSEEATRHLAREIALCIAPRVDVSATASSIHDILSVGSLDEAMSVLDDYGVRDLDRKTWDSVESSAAADPGETDTDETAYPTDDDRVTLRPEPEDRSAPMAGAGRSDARAENGGGGELHPRGTDATKVGSVPSQRRSRDRETLSTSRMTSYVSYGDSIGAPETGDEAEKRSLVDQAGVARVLAYEAARGRFPEEQSHANPGFDVLSLSADRVVLRRIEIKSLAGRWTDRGVHLSSTQFDDARANPDVYWLYVVENAEDDDAFEVHRIRNPAGQVTKYGFDGGWRGLDEPDVRREADGRPTASSTRSLLGWRTAPSGE